MFSYEVDKEEYKLKICVDVCCSFTGAKYIISDVMYMPKGKRKPVSIATRVRNMFEYSSKDLSGRRKYIREKYLEYCTQNDIENAIQYAYSMIKPNIDDVIYSAH